MNRDYGELYSRRDDPHERRNRWSDPSLATLRAELREMLLDEVLCALDILPPRVQRPAPPPKKWTPRTWRGIDSAHRSR